MLEPLGRGGVVRGFGRKAGQLLLHRAGRQPKLPLLSCRYERGHASGGHENARTRLQFENRFALPGF
jgi:hypothetical protein